MNDQNAPAPKPKKLRAPKRDPDAIAVDYEARVLRIRWGGPLKARKLVASAKALLEQAAKLCNDKCPEERALLFQQAKELDGRPFGIPDSILGEEEGAETE